MWNGQFAKHRDYQHGSFMEHARANGARTRVGRTARVRRNPITGAGLKTVAIYYLVTLVFSDDTEYEFLIYSDSGGPPSQEEVDAQINEYLKNPVPGGRRVEDYTENDEETPEFTIEDLVAVETQPVSAAAFSIDDLL